MTAISYSRGHKIYYNEFESRWKYCDNDEPASHNRACKKCNCYPTVEGYDACLGKLNGVKNACCGHGKEEMKFIEKGEQ